MNAEIIGPELLIVFFIVPIVVGIWAAIDAAGLPDWAFHRAGQNKTLWIVLPIAGIFLCGIVALVSAIVWFTSVKKTVVAAASGGNPAA